MKTIKPDTKPSKFKQLLPETGKVVFTGALDEALAIAMIYTDVLIKESSTLNR